MSGRGLKGSKSLLALPSILELAEASAYRITPTYVYAFRKSKKTGGIVPVHIKHANVSKYWDDLVDPEVGNPLANTVIGEIPKYYKAASDLKLKDPTKKLSDVMSKDGGSDEPAAPAPKEKPKTKPSAGLEQYQLDADVLNQKLNYKPGSTQAKAVELLLKNGNDVDASVELAGTDEDEDALEQAMDVVFSVVAKAEKAGLIATEEDDEGTTHIDLKAGATSPIVQPKPEPAPAPAAAPAKPAPPAPVLPDESFKIQMIGKGVEHFNKLPVEMRQKYMAGVLSVSQQELVALAALYSHSNTGDPTPHISAALQQAFGSVGVTLNASDFVAKAKKIGLVVTGPDGGTYIAGPTSTLPPPTSAGSTQPLVAPTAPAPAPEAPPKKPQTVPAPQGALSVPPLATLKDAGDASALGGLHSKRFLVDGAGNKYLFKPADKTKAEAGAAYATLAAGVVDHTVPVVSGEVPGLGYGSVQPVLPDVSTDLSKVALNSLTPAQLNSLMKERVMDWALSSHDTKAANFLLTKDGKLVGIDKEQALRFLGSDSLSTDYKPNPTKQVYADLFDQYRKKKLDLSGSLPAMFDAIKKVESTSDASWMAALEPYFSTLPASQQKSKKEAALARKKGVRKDFENFLTGLMRERGDFGPNDSFQFPTDADEEPTKKKKKPENLGGLSAPPMGSVLSPPAVPELSSLVPQGKAEGIGGAGQKYFFADASGKKWLLKLAASKSGSTPEPFRVAVQEIFSQVSSLARPGKSVPVGGVGAGFNGFPATLQPWLDLGNPPTLKGTLPPNLKDSEKKDVAEEHALDWLLSQHDTHAANLVRRADGAIISIDKEQGFKYLLPNNLAPQGDKLDIDFHPNAAYGEDEPYYNKFWRSFANGGMDFDPTEMKGVIDRIEAISDADYTKLLSKYTATAPFKDDPKKLSAFIEQALARKKNIRGEFESFVSGLYEKRTKKKGKFTFADGWIPAGGVAAPKKPKKAATVAAPTPPPPEPGTPKAIPYPKKRKAVNGVEIAAFESPLAGGNLGIQNPEMVEGNAPSMTTPKKSAPPPGYPPADPGKVWKVAPFSSWVSDHFYKAKAPNGPDGTPDANSPDVLLKFNNTSVDAVQAALKKAGVSPNAKVFAKDAKVIVIVNKAEWEAAKTAKTEIAVQVPEPVAMPTSTELKFTSIPKAGQLANPEALVGLATMANLNESKEIGYSKAFASDSDGVELMCLQVQRCSDSKGDFYRFNFKLRPEQRAELGVVGGTSTTFNFKSATYDAAKDSWQQGTTNLSSSFAFAADQWTDGESTVHIGSNSEQKFAARNWAIADVRLKPGENLLDGFKRVTGLVSPALAEKMTKQPDTEDIERVKLSSLLWSVAPQASDKLTGKDRTVANLKKALLAKGITEEQMKSVVLEETSNGQISPVLPGRAQKIGQDLGAKFIACGVANDVNALVDQIHGSTISMAQRLLQGVGEFATSGSGDFATGGGDYVFTKVMAQSSVLPSWGGGAKLVFDISELDRLDCFAHTGDNWGTTNPENSSWGSAWKNRKTVDSVATSASEVCFRRGINSRKLLHVIVPDKNTAAQVIQKLKAQGVTKINGMTPEELVLPASGVPSAKAVYDTLLKPAGY